MKIYFPRLATFKKEGKALRARVKQDLNITLNINQIHNALARAYGWSHYHELAQQHPDAVATGTLRGTLDASQLSDLRARKLKAVASLLVEDYVQTHQLTGVETDLDTLLTQLHDHPEALEVLPAQHRAAIIDRQMWVLKVLRKRFEYQDLQQLSGRATQLQLPLCRENLHRHTLTFSPDLGQRLSAVKALTGSTLLAHCTGRWLVAESELSSVLLMLSMVYQVDHQQIRVVYDSPLMPREPQHPLADTATAAEKRQHVRQMIGELVDSAQADPTHVTRLDLHALSETELLDALSVYINEASSTEQMTRWRNAGLQLLTVCKAVYGSHSAGLQQITDGIDSADLLQQALAHATTTEAVATYLTGLPGEFEPSTQRFKDWDAACEQVTQHALAIQAILTRYRVRAGEKTISMPELMAYQHVVFVRPDSSPTRISPQSAAFLAYLCHPTAATATAEDTLVEPRDASFWYLNSDVYALPKGFANLMTQGVTSGIMVNIASRSMDTLLTQQSWPEANAMIANSHQQVFSADTAQGRFMQMYFRDVDAEIFRDQLHAALDTKPKAQFFLRHPGDRSLAQPPVCAAVDNLGSMREMDLEWKSESATP